MLSIISDVVGIIGFIISVLVLIFSHSLFKNMEQQKSAYNKDRLSIQTDLIALRQNIWDDNLDNLSIRSRLRQSLYSYRNKYFAIIFPFCLFHIQKSLLFLNGPIKESKKEKLCAHLDYLIANLDKKEYLKK